MGEDMKGLLIVTIAYTFIAALFYFDGFGGLVRGTFFTNVKTIKGVGEQLPLAFGVGLAYFWALLGSVYYLTNSNTVQKENVDNGNSEALVAASKEV